MQRAIGLLGHLLLVACSLFSLTTAEWAAQVERREAVKAAFMYNYGQYEKYAFGYDVLQPLSKQGVDNDILAGFGGTIVDAMSTMHIMGMADGPEYRRALEHVRNTDFTMTSVGEPVGRVSLFELTIRYLGGLLSAFQLGGERKEHHFLIDRAATLANVLSKAWGLGTRIPYNDVDINRGRPIPIKKRSANLAEAGTLTMEWRSLSRYTGNQTYWKLVEQSMDAILKSSPIFPGLWAQGIWPDTERTHHDYITWGGGTDSFYEYLIKYPLLIGDENHKYLDAYSDAIDSSIRILLQKTGAGNLTFLADWSERDGHGLIALHSHLACFCGGNIAMAGRAMHRDDWVTVGLELTESCAKTYRITETGLGPIAWGWFDQLGKASSWHYVSYDRRSFYNQTGIFISMSAWNHQPEVMESVFYAWRITGQEFWREWAWQAFEQMRLHCDTGSGWAGIRNVNDRSTGVYDEVQTFLFAELLKYLYLIFDDPDRFSLDDWVFNTEAHPQRRAPNPRFGTIQGRFPYRRITNGHQTFAPPTDFHSPPPVAVPHDTLRIQTPSRKAHAVKSSPLFSRPAHLDLPGCQDSRSTSWQRRVFCRSYALLLWPFVLLVGYRASLFVGRLMQRAERQMYRLPQSHRL